MSKSKFVHKTITQTLLEAIRKRILTGELKAGMSLKQDALAKFYGVSRIPVREALLQLESEGLVEFEAHKGAYVTELSVSRINELFQLRALIETHILSLAIDNMTEDDYLTAKDCLDSFDVALESGTNIENWSDMNYAFHEALYHPANQPETMKIVSSLNTRCDRYIRVQLLFTEGVEKAEEEHRQLLEAYKNRDKREAKKILKKHILEAAGSIINLLPDMK